MVDLRGQHMELWIGRLGFESQSVLCGYLQKKSLLLLRAITSFLGFALDCPQCNMAQHVKYLSKGTETKLVDGEPDVISSL